MVALVRAGVTATCSTAGHTRYGHLEVDSNLPDARIALGGPSENAFTAAVLAAADPAYAAEVTRQLAGGRVRVFVPASAPLDAVWRPDADLRGVLALPVLIVAGAVEELVDDLGDAEIVVDQDAPAGCGAFEERTVALLNRGVPGFAVERDGTLHTSLMRSCTGWPSGTWIDPPARKAPDGSNFQLQHWSHTFDFAFVSGVGDWRSAGMVCRSAEFNHPLQCVPISSGSAGLAADGSLLSVSPAGAVALGALKPRGNPTAVGSAAVRLAVGRHPAVGRNPRRAGRCRALLVGGHGLGGDRHRPAGELPGRHGPALQLHGYQIATVAARLDAPAVIDATGQALAPDAEAAQPLYARYWLHNRGPAPLGGLPAVAHLHPEALTAAPGETVAAAADGGQRLQRCRRPRRGPDATTRPAGTPIPEPAPGHPAGTPTAPSNCRRVTHRETEVSVRIPDDAAPGRYPVRAQLTLSGDVPPAWHQSVEDVCVITVGDPDGELVRLAAEPADIVVARG